MYGNEVKGVMGKVEFGCAHNYTFARNENVVSLNFLSIISIVKVNFVYNINASSKSIL